ncbi:S-methyl-5-thioribose kinase [Rhodobacteraceae bacterium F11138]|nr:S-methyl-5-thioribose kinase [Rhodobacteraceae bacterium F11138]
MSNLPAGYAPLTVETLGARLGGLKDVASRIGGDPGTWDVREVGDGNLNLVFIVSGPTGSVVVKQALPYVRLVGDSWPLPLKRAFFEYHALTRQAARDPGVVPGVYHFDEAQALIVMEFLTPHTILRGRLIAGQKTGGLADTLGRFAARTAFRGSDLSLPTAERKADAALFLANVELCDITEGLVFTDPYFDAERNHHTAGLNPVVAMLRSDVAMKTQVQHMLTRFASNGETMLHGDLHTGSVMCTGDDVKVIDPEFACYGPMGFDLGMMLANFLMAYFSQPAHRSASDLKDFQDWILLVTQDICAAYTDEFTRLWHDERTGILYPRSLFEDQGHSSEAALTQKLAAIWQDAMGFCGIEMHRRVLSLAHNAEFETIEDETLRAGLEARNLMMGRDLILNRADTADAGALIALAQSYNERDFT